MQSACIIYVLDDFGADTLNYLPMPLLQCEPCVLHVAVKLTVPAPLALFYGWKLSQIVLISMATIITSCKHVEQGTTIGLGVHM